MKRKEDKIENRGGARKGTGPKPKYDSPLVNLTIAVPEKHKKEILVKIREIIDTYKIKK